MTARRHHYLSQSYLANFTHDGTKDGKFFVLDVRKGHGFPTSPLNVGVERDFNRVDIEGQDDDALETALAAFDGRAGQAIRNVNQSRKFPDSEDYSYIINFLSLVAVRNPHFRESFNRARTQTMNMVSELLVSDRRIYETHMRKAHEAGYVKDKAFPYEKMKSFIEERRYEIKWEPESHHHAEFHAQDSLLPVLARRRWSLVIAPDIGPELICCDHPATLIPMGGEGPRHYGYGTPATEVYLPLGPRVGFLGVFHDDLDPILVAKPIGVAGLNTRVLKNARRHVFSTRQKFSVVHNGLIREVPIRTVMGAARARRRRTTK